MAWQVIESQHDPLDYGTQLEYKPGSAWDINFNTYIGNESSVDNPNYRTRYFADLYWRLMATSDKWSFASRWAFRCGSAAALRPM